MKKDIDIYTKVERCIRWGYADRNPLSPRFIRQQQHEYRANQQNAESISYTQSYPTASGFALLGISGLGKSTTLRRVLGRYPQVIRHECYNGIPFNETQITYIHMDAPNDGSLKGLCGAFFEKIDERRIGLGVSFHTIASRNMRLTLEMRRALLSGKEVNLRQYLDLAPFKMEDFQQAVQQDINPPEPPAPDPEIVCKPDVREQAILTLLGLGLDRPSATKYVNRSLASFPGCTHSPILAQNAYANYLQQSSSRGAIPVSSVQPCLGNNNAENLSAGFVGL